ncbi:putative adhesin [Flavobacterium sp. CF136]|jgi:hypothetical protein|uniref:putative adhesin n=1 Tax=Flavobacterium sp. (strain CF136) TaxID=1144313 RepID=UPI000271CA1A|nr:hypothetical protein [Flavobacterium sp. CF136]EJL61191.1 hypothetical protein PMI10_03544 [Flavobacterium sp. CF136]
MNKYFLSSHAAGDPLDTTTVPHGCTVKFYVPQGEELSNEEAFVIFEELSHGRTPGGTINHSFTGGQLIPNYDIWNLSEYPDYSGVFLVGSDTPSILLTSYTQANPLKLSDLFNQLDTPEVLYWVACA